MFATTSPTTTIPTDGVGPASFDSEIGDHAAALSHHLAGQPTDAPGVAWRRNLYEAYLSHPEVAVRCAIAANGSLAVLRLAALDADPAVRFACTFNPFVIDADVQLILAADSELTVVQSLLDHVDPYLETAWVIVKSPHRLARLRLARRQLRTELLEALGHDRHRSVRIAAAISLGCRQPCGVAA